jgi:hypothetical protein
MERRADLVSTLLALIAALAWRDSLRGQFQYGSLAEAVHLSNGT